MLSILKNRNKQSFAIFGVNHIDEGQDMKTDGVLLMKLFLMGIAR